MSRWELGFFRVYLTKGVYMGAGRVARGILVGGSLGAFSAIFGISENMFFAVGVGMIAGCLAGLTMMWLEKRRK